MLKFHRKVFAFPAGSERCLFDVHAAGAQQLVESGRAEVRQKDRRRGVTAISILAGNHRVVARAGSYGIHRERIAPGPTGNAGIVFAHKSTQEKAIYA